MLVANRPQVAIVTAIYRWKMSNQLRFISTVLYRMKRRYGLPVNFVKIISEDIDIKTGVKTLQRVSLALPRVIPLPSTVKREFFYDLAYITGNKDFTYGATTLSHTRKFLIDAQDLGSWVLQIGDALIYDGKRYDIVEIDESENSRAYVVTAKESESVQLTNLIAVSLYDELAFTDGVT